MTKNAVAKGFTLHQWGDGSHRSYPQPPSQITGITFDWQNMRSHAPGSDNWPLSWAQDGHQYTSWGDGGGFGGTNTIGRTSWGIGRIEGDFGSEVGVNLFGGLDGLFDEDEVPVELRGKSYGLLALGSTPDLYAWWGPGSNDTSYSETRLLRSLDGGASWSKSTWDLRAEGLDTIMPTICQFGQDYAWNTDGYVYHYFIGLDPAAVGLDIHDTGIYLARCLIADIWDWTQYEWWDGSGWSSDPADRAFTFTDPDGDGVGWCLSVQYLQPLGKYVLVTQHTTANAGLLGFYQASNPQGPWTPFERFEADAPLGDGFIDPNVFFVNFSSKWMNGADSVMALSGLGSGSGTDALILVPCTFQVN